MRIDEVLAETKSLDVHFGAAVLHIEYRLPSYTVAEMERIRAKGDNDPNSLVMTIQEMVVGWDLTRIDDSGAEVPVDVTNSDDVRNYVPSSVVRGIVQAVRADNSPSGE